MRVIALDYGKARIGVAISDELGMLAHPRPYLNGRDLKEAFRDLGQLVEEEGITQFLVGLPRQLNGKEGLSARRARQFAERVEQRFGIPVALVDEWLTSVEAHARLQEQGLSSREQRQRVDSAAAALLLQSWLEQRARQTEQPE